MNKANKRSCSSGDDKQRDGSANDSCVLNEYKTRTFPLNKPYLRVESKREHQATCIGMGR